MSWELEPCWSKGIRISVLIFSDTTEVQYADRGKQWQKVEGEGVKELIDQMHHAVEFNYP